MESKVGRNDPCPCGSGKKYKQCHMGKDEEAKKTYTTGGKRKFKAKLLETSTGVQGVFQAKPMSMEAPAPTPYRFLRYKMTTEDYRFSAEPASLPFEMPGWGPGAAFEVPEQLQPEILPEVYVMTTLDYRTARK